MIQDLVRAAASGDDDALGRLEETVAAQPDALTGHLHQMLDLDLLWPASLYRAAGDNVVRRVVDQVDRGQPVRRLNHLLLILAHTRGPLAEAAFRRWEQTRAPGMERLHVGPLRYAEQGGWALLPDGTHRELCAPVAHRLVMTSAPRASDGTTCPWCDSPLWTVVDLTTDEPAVADVLAHAGWRGRLRITTCHLCACYTTLYCQVTPDGGSTWAADNAPPPYLQTSTEEPPPLTATVGGPRATPYQASAWDRGGSTLGGHPQWIQDAEHAACATCGQPMDYLGLVGGADLDEYGEGAYYLHLHAACGLAAVSYQQS
ncbi:hypothetical protein [Micromonospora echinofusca]|uniref:DUF1963 domain-containing protein n=1 Tax=Micromonospora echinofusca TaxID=47858 RepID=A0ABS3VM53_MICEH|nr:hypothetical protein [Micromonospora echinofusca]MBO4205558.1 hypothetical protein [Micromonospora echinofusca]